jgi:recombinational DNA repair ATPase RecF
MIKVESITIKEFRGIRDLTLDFKENNFAICGPNGTGKSGVVDALEFVLTGNVSRLSGEGRGDISVKDHGPHVDKRNDPAKAEVTAKISLPGSKKTTTIVRNLKNPKTVTVTPPDAEVIAAIKRVERHPEIVLSRRELIRYVLATPGDRAKEVQALLRLDQIEQVRASLQKIANALEKEIAPLDSSVKQAKDGFLRVTGLTEMGKNAVLAAANAKRTILGLPLLVDFTATTSLKDGLAASSSETSGIPKTQAITDIKSARDSLNKLASAETKVQVKDAMAQTKTLADDPQAVAGAKQEAFLRSGLSLALSDACPLCDNQWDLGKLKAHIQQKIFRFEEIAKKKAALATKFSPLTKLLNEIDAALAPLMQYGALHKPPVTTQVIRTYRTACRTTIGKLNEESSLTDNLTALATFADIPTQVADEIAALEKAVLALPEPSKQDEARDWLTAAHERLESWRDAMRSVAATKAKAELAKKVSTAYTTTSDSVLLGIYQKVEKDFAALYRFVNSDDEEKFEAKLTPSLGKLGFDVDFYGRGFFPPGAYHSEGHQDGMGLCLYLALMRHLQGEGFTFAVLDDVLMSVDIAHRRQVCVLLEKHFPSTQFIMTTHDPIWLKHMRTENLVGSRNLIQFRNWTVDQGPTRWDSRDVWAEIDEYLKNNDVRSAAALLRHYLEYEATELCHRLRAPVEFRADAQYQLGELLPAAIKHKRDLLKKAKASANSWNKKDEVAQVAAREASFVKLVDESKTEQWQVNVAVHFNSWANLSKEEFAPVVQAYKNLFTSFTCAGCLSYLRVSPDRESAEFLCCDCGTTKLGLLPKQN